MATNLDPKIVPEILNRRGARSAKKVKNDPLSNVNDPSYNEFKNIIEKNSIDKELKISGHAAKRISERNIDLDGDEFIKLRSAVNKLKGKGSKDSLIITNKGAYIVDVNNEIVVTAMDKRSVLDNIFTKIDSTLIID